jgi:uncharacterized membrane protein
MTADKSRLARQTIRVCYLLMLAILVVTSLPGFAHSNAPVWFLVAIRTVPLLIFAYGLFRDNLRTYAWLSFVLLFYFTQAVVNIFTDLNYYLSIIMVIITVTLFLSAMFYIRWQKQDGRRL